MGVARRMTRLEYLEDLENEPKAAPKVKPKRVKVLHPFQVVHDGTAYWPNAVLTVPAAFADEWITNQWVTEDVAS
ncbi:MAG: hypothetical protein JWR34_1793 [Mycobacterium sp.]|nr:hypothetical protein [Mycobacterium sp.]